MDISISGVTGLAGQCLTWVDRQVGIAGWGGSSAAAAYDTFSGSGNTTTIPLPGDIAIFPANRGSSNGHTGVWNGLGVFSVLSDGKVHFTDLKTLSSYEGDTTPIFVSASSQGTQFQQMAQAAAASLTAQLQTVQPFHKITGSDLGGTDNPTIIQNIPGAQKILDATNGTGNLNIPIQHGAAAIAAAATQDTTGLGDFFARMGLFILAFLLFIAAIVILLRQPIAEGVKVAAV